jgi:protoporphyrinogen oxidase
MTATRAPVVVLGAGLTGLAAARELSQRGITVRVLERERVVGGHATTHEERGFHFDRTGHLLHLRNARIKALVEAILPGRLREIQRRSAVFSHGVYTRYPFQCNAHGLPPEIAFECVSGFVNAHFAANKQEPKNFAEYCELHFGRGISEHFMLPYNSRMWGVPASEITSEWCERFVPLPELSDVLRGALGASSPELGYNARFFYPEQGIGVLSNALAADLKVELERAPERIDWTTRTVHVAGEAIRYERLISTIPLPQLIALGSDAPAAVREAAGKLRWTRLHYFDLALAAPNPNPYHWIYVPEARFPFYRIGCYSHFSDKLAPQGKSSLYVELVDRRRPSPEQALQSVLLGLKELGLLRREEQLEFWRLRSLDFAYVLYDAERRPALDVIQPFLQQQGVLSTGRYGGWNYSSMEDAMLFGIDAAERVAVELS